MLIGPSWEPNLLPYWAPNLGPIREQDVCPNFALTAAKFLFSNSGNSRAKANPPKPWSCPKRPFGQWMGQNSSADWGFFSIYRSGHLVIKFWLHGCGRYSARAYFVLWMTPQNEELRLCRNSMPCWQKMNNRLSLLYKSSKIIARNKLNGWKYTLYIDSMYIMQSDAIKHCYFTVGLFNWKSEHYDLL